MEINIANHSVLARWPITVMDMHMTSNSNFGKLLQTDLTYLVIVTLNSNPSSKQYLQRHQVME